MYSDPPPEIKRFGIGLQKLTSFRFNNLLKASGKTSFAFDRWNLKNQDLSAFNLSNSGITNGTFENIIFGSIENIEFSTCIFSDCSFKNSRGERIAIKNTLFFECNMNKINLCNVDVGDLRIIDCKNTAKLNTQNCRIFGTLLIKGDTSHNQYQFLKDLDISESANGGLIYLNSKQFPFVNWETIRIASKIPILQISAYGVLLVLTISTVLNVLSEFLRKTRSLCKEITNSADVAPYCDASALFHYFDIKLDLYLYIIAFFSLIVASILQSIFCPQDVLEYSKTNWTRDLRRPLFQYKIISIKNLYVSWLAFFLYSIGASYIFYSIIGRLVKSFEILLST
jgi:hypothetical protein